MSTVKALFALMILTMGCEAKAQDSCDTSDLDASLVYVDLDGSGMLDEIVLSSNELGDVTIAVAFDVPETGDKTSWFDQNLTLEVKDVNGDKLDDLTLVVSGKEVGLVDADWASLSKDSCGPGDHEPDAEVIYQSATKGKPFTMGPVKCHHQCVEITYEDGFPVCKRREWKCTYHGYETSQ